MESWFLRRYTDELECVKNFDLAKADNFEGWCIHHKLEAFYSATELKGIGRYWKVPARELIFLRRGEHFKWPHKALQKGYWHHSAETRAKISALQIGKKNSESSNRKRSETLKGLKRSEETKAKMRIAAKLREEKKRAEREKKQCPTGTKTVQ